MTLTYKEKLDLTAQRSMLKKIQTRLNRLRTEAQTKIATLEEDERVTAARVAELEAKQAGEGGATGDRPA